MATNPDVYTLDQAEEDIADLRGDSTVKEEHQEIGSIVLDANAGALATGAITGPDTWHSLGTLTGFTVTVGRYKITAADNMVVVDVKVTAGGANANSVVFSNTMPAAYRPAAGRAYPLGKTGNLGAALTDQSPRLFVDTTGAVTVLVRGSDTSDFANTVHVPLD